MIGLEHISLGISMIVAILLVVNIFIGRGDKSGGEYKEIAKQVADINLQIANLRTELARDGARRAEEMRRAFVPREEYQEHRELVLFTLDLTKEVHRRMHPDAAIHQPGGTYGAGRNG